MPGDHIVSIDGVTGSQSAIADQINSHTCAGKPKDGCEATTPAIVVVERDGQEQTLKITPVYDAQVERNRLGFASVSSRSIPELPRLPAFPWILCGT